jgi:hypothetical protein
VPLIPQDAIADEERCAGSGEAPVAGTHGGGEGVCAVCDGRFAVDGGKLVEHRPASAAS